MPIATLSTDIGTNDYLSGAIKGQLLTVNPALNLVDITHTLSSTNYQQTAYICSNAYKYFPPDTLHILIVNLFETIPNKVLFAEYNQQYIICPDNGILTMITGTKPEKVYTVEVQTNSNIGTLNYKIIPIEAIEFDPSNPRNLLITREDLPHGPSDSDPFYEKKLKEFESLKQTSETIKNMVFEMLWKFISMVIAIA